MQEIRCLYGFVSLSLAAAGWSLVAGRWSLVVVVLIIGSFCDGNGSTTDLFETEDRQECQHNRRRDTTLQYSMTSSAARSQLFRPTTFTT